MRAIVSVKGCVNFIFIMRLEEQAYGFVNFYRNKPHKPKLGPKKVPFSNSLNQNNHIPMVFAHAQKVSLIFWEGVTQAVFQE